MSDQQARGVALCHGKLQQLIENLEARPEVRADLEKGYTPDKALNVSGTAPTSRHSARVRTWATSTSGSE